MGALWDDFLQEGSYKGVKFDFVSAREQHGSVLDVQEFPNRDGAFVAKRARKALRLSVMAIFIEDDYPDSDLVDRGMNKLIDKLEDGTPGELVHPVYGSIQASAEAFDVSHDAEDAADSGTIAITFVEHTETAGIVFQQKESPAGKANETRSNAADVSVNAEVMLNAVLNGIEQGTSIAVAYASLAYASEVNSVNLCTTAATLASTAADVLEANGPIMSALEIQSTVNQALAAAEAAVLNLENYATEEAYETSRSLLAMAASLGDLAKALISTKPPLITFTVGADITLLAWVHAVYGDSSRVDEVLSLNSIEDPLLMLAGTVLRAYAV